MDPPPTAVTGDSAGVLRHSHTAVPWEAYVVLADLVHHGMPNILCYYLEDGVRR